MQSSTLCIVLAAILASSVGSPISIIGTVLTDIGNLLKGILDLVKAIVSKLLAILNPLVISLDTLVTNLLNNVAGISAETLTAVRDLFAQLKADIKAVTTALAKLVEAIGNKAEADVLFLLRNAVRDALAALKITLAKLKIVLQQIVSQATNDVSGLVANIVAVLDKIVAALDTAVTNVFDKLSGVLSGLDFDKVVAGLKDFLNKQSQIVLDLANKAAAGVLADLESVEGISEDLLKLVGGLGPAIKNVFDTLDAVVTNVSADTVAALTQSLNNLKELIDSILVAVKADPALAQLLATVEGALSTIVTLVTVIVTPVVNGLIGLNISVSINASLQGILDLLARIIIN